FFFFSSRRRHTRWPRDWSSDVCSSDLDVRLERENRTPRYSRSRRTSSANDRVVRASVRRGVSRALSVPRRGAGEGGHVIPRIVQIGRASCRERGESLVVAGGLRKKRYR